MLTLFASWAVKGNQFAGDRQTPDPKTIQIAVSCRLNQRALIVVSDWLSVLCRRDPGPPEECWAALLEGLHKSWADFCLPPDQGWERVALPPHGPLLQRHSLFPPWAFRSSPAIEGWSGGTWQCLGEGEWSPSLHCEGRSPLQGFPWRCWTDRLGKYSVILLH